MKSLTYISPQGKMRTAFILYNNSLLASGLERLLKQRGVDVVGRAATTRNAVAQIGELNPDVIIVEAEKDKPKAERLLSRLLAEHLQARVLRVSLENNTVTLYTGCRWTASTVEDLVKAIRRAERGRERHGIDKIPAQRLTKSQRKAL